MYSSDTSEIAKRRPKHIGTCIGQVRQDTTQRIQKKHYGQTANTGSRRDKVRVDPNGCCAGAEYLKFSLRTDWRPLLTGNADGNACTSTDHANMSVRIAKSLVQRPGWNGK